MSSDAIEIRVCKTKPDFALAEQLTRDYVSRLDMDLSFQDIDLEMKTFSTMYSAPRGHFLLAHSNGQLAGGVGYRSLGAGVCEMKRLFVYEGFQGRGVGRLLCLQLIETAKNDGYRLMRLDTLGHMIEAIALYLDLGFQRIAAYRYNPDPHARYYELNLRDWQAPVPLGKEQRPCHPTVFGRGGAGP